MAPSLLSHRIILAIAGICLTAPVATSGQTVHGTVVASGAGNPLEGATVIALSLDDQRLAWSLTDAKGKFSFRLSKPGHFFLRVERIGHAATRSEVLQVGDGQSLTHDMAVDIQAISLEGLLVEADRRDCEIRPEAGLPTARLWEEARKALDSAVATAQEGAYFFLMQHFERDLDTRGHRIQNERFWFDPVVRGRSFESVGTVNLIENGFMQDTPLGPVYYGPDAEVMLSDEFLDSHCFQIRSRGNDALVGLDFEPTGDRGVPEISGTLWLEPKTGRLRSLDFAYKNLGFRAGDAALGGTVEFSGLPNGRWFVRTWSLRTPMLAWGRPRPKILGLREQGGIVYEVQDADGQIIIEPGTATLEGRVARFDSGDPVSGATLTISGYDITWTTDQEGIFTIGSLADGSQFVRVTHPKLSALGYPGTANYVRLTADRTSLMDFVVPTEQEVIEEMCGSTRPEAGGVLAGWVKNVGRNRRPRDFRVRIRSKSSSGSGDANTQIDTEIRPRSDGFFIYCGLPLQTPVSVRLRRGTDPVWEDTVRFHESGEVVPLTIFVGPSG